MKKKYPLLSIRGGIYDNTLALINDKLADLQGEVVYMTIESLGGDPACGYRIMRLLQAKYGKIITLVPGEAYSTATLMALGSDEIYMNKSACFGPLDIQIKHPTDGSMISSLEIRDILNTLAGSLATYAEVFYESLKGPHVQLGKKDAADLALRTATDLLRPIAEKINPIDFQRSTRSSKVGQKYAENLLLSRMLKGYPELARAVSFHLANNYDNHGYAITMEEAGDLALNVKDVSLLPEWGLIKEKYKKYLVDGVWLEEIEVDDGKNQEKSQTTKSVSAKLKKKVGGES
jgi:hypothetical protein